MGKFIDLTNEQKSDAVKSYQSGKTVGEIAKQLGVCRSSAVRVLMEGGEKIRHSTGWKMSPEERAEAKRLHKSGMPISHIANTMGKSRSTVRYSLFENPRKKGRSLAVDQLDEETIRQILEDYDSGSSVYQLQSKFKISPQTVGKVLVLNNRKVKDSRKKKGIAHPKFTGGRLITHEGYVRVLVPDDHPFAGMRNLRGYVSEHRLVMAEVVGRELFPHERVHHRDGNRQNNDPDNLELWEHAHPPGQRQSESLMRHCPTCQCNLHTVVCRQKDLFPFG